MRKHKVKGFMTLQGVLMVILLGLLALSFLQIYGSQFSALTANRRALQAQQFAQSEADFLRNVSYDELDTTVHARQEITGTNGWMSEVSLAAETTVNGVQQRIGTIKVYRNSSVIAPDFSLQVPLTSQGGSRVLIETFGKAQHGSKIAKPKGYKHMKNLQCLLALSTTEMKDGDNLHGVIWQPFVVDHGDYWTVCCRIFDWGKGRNGMYDWDYTVLYFISYET